MADNFLQKGDVITVTAPADKTTGAGVKVGSFFGVALHSALSGAELEIMLTGVFTLPKLSTDVVTVGAPLYWDNGNSRLTVTASTHKLVGAATAAAGNPSATVSVRLSGEIGDA